MNNLTCPRCGSSSVTTCGFYLRSDGSQVRRYQCKTCSRSFAEDYIRHPVNVSEKSCPKCTSSKVTARGLYSRLDGSQVRRYSNRSIN